jgi:hypothetical protein
LILETSESESQCKGVLQKEKVDLVESNSDANGYRQDTDGERLRRLKPYSKRLAIPAGCLSSSSWDMMSSGLQSIPEEPVPKPIKLLGGIKSGDSDQTAVAAPPDSLKDSERGGTPSRAGLDIQIIRRQERQRRKPAFRESNHADYGDSGSSARSSLDTSSLSKTALSVSAWIETLVDFQEGNYLRHITESQSDDRVHDDLSTLVSHPLQVTGGQESTDSTNQHSPTRVVKLIENDSTIQTAAPPQKSRNNYQNALEISHLSQAMIQAVLDGYLAHVTQIPGSRGTSNYNGGSKRTRLRTEQPSNLKALGKRRRLDDKDEQDEDGDDSSDGQRGFKGGLKSKSSIHRPLACPFYQRDPTQKHNLSCRGSGFKFYRLK